MSEDPGAVAELDSSEKEDFEIHELVADACSYHRGEDYASQMVIEMVEGDSPALGLEERGTGAACHAS